MRAPTPSALASLPPTPDGFRVLPDPLNGQPVLRIPARTVDVRVALDRSYESSQSGEPSQDYLAVRCDPRRLSFAVTDGVGSSFLGDVAAQILAIQLADWFATASEQDKVASVLQKYLQQLSNEVADRVAKWPIPDTVPALIRAALDDQRAYGSESMFVAGTVDLTGRRDATVTVAWLGDSQLRAVMRDGRVIDHSGHTADRWSSRLGPRGTVLSRTWAISDLARIVACTDGVVPILDDAIDLADPELQEALSARALRPGNDDMALVDIGLAPRAMPGGDAGNQPLWRRLAEEPNRRHARSTPAGTALRRIMRAVGPLTPVEVVPATGTAPDAPVPKPTSTSDTPAAAQAVEPPPGVAPPGPLAWRRVDRGRELYWAPVPGADSYAVQLCREKKFAQPLLYSVAGLTFVVPPMGPPLFGRIRSIAGGEPGPWGPVHDLTERPPADPVIP